MSMSAESAKTTHTLPDRPTARTPAAGGLHPLPPVRLSPIRVLPENLANKIAAGEVVERPASVVKELVENAIDAHAQRISISLLQGGIEWICVQDDGDGIDREEVCLAFLSHATSKISNEEDLAAISTLGFRGEALPSIASVSKVRLITQTAGSEEGSEVLLEGGRVADIRSVGVPVGSTFEVSNLFYNMPARKKFLKSQGTELAHINNVVFQQALAHPEIHFELTHEGRTLLTAPAVTLQRDRILTLYGEAILKNCLEMHRHPDGSPLAIDLFLSKVPLVKSHQKDQSLFINRRSVKSPLISRAVYDAYSTLIMKGEHPFYVLYLSMDTTQVDVNVHPTKKEVRFQDTDTIYHFIKKTIREGLTGTSQGGLTATASVVTPVDHGESTNLVTPVSNTLYNQSNSSGENIAPSPQTKNKTRELLPHTTMGWPQSKQQDGRQKGKSLPSGQEEQLPLFSQPLIRPMGQIYGTFLLAEVDGELVVVDQHTAHERILYEAFLKDAGPMTIQPLLIPRQVNLTAAQATLISEHLDLFCEIGFKIELFGETTFLIREIPIQLADVDFESFLVGLSEDFSEMEVIKDIDEARHKMIASMACHAAVRANQALGPPQIQTLLHDYFSRHTPPTCPHGRPVMIKYSLLELEKQFQRR